MGCGQRGQGNFELATNCDYSHEGRLTLAKVSIKLALSAHKVLSTPHGTGACRCAFKAGEKKQREIFFGIRIENVCYIIHDMIR